MAGAVPYLSHKTQCMCSDAGFSDKGAGAKQHELAVKQYQSCCFPVSEPFGSMTLLSQGSSASAQGAERLDEEGAAAVAGLAAMACGEDAPGTTPAECRVVSPGFMADVHGVCVATNEQYL